MELKHAIAFEYNNSLSKALMVDEENGYGDSALVLQNDETKARGEPGCHVQVDDTANYGWRRENSSFYFAFTHFAY